MYIYTVKNKMELIMHIIPAAFGPIMDRSEGIARGFILCKHEPVGRVLIQYRDKRLRDYGL